jgi:Pectate lyase superfamily protein
MYPFNDRSAQLKKVWKYILIAGLALVVTIGGYGLYSSHSATFKSESKTGVKSAPQVTQASANCSSPSGGLTNNPIADRYGKVDYVWTEQIKWNCVYNITDFEGKTALDRFNAARDEAVSNGGGVVYFPAGTYEFSESLYLKNGVVIRGEPPTVQEAKDKQYRPPTKFVFPQYNPQLSGYGTSNDSAFKQIVTTAPDSDSNIGIVDVDINRAAIAFTGNLETGRQQNILIFGVRSNNVAEPDPQVPDPSFQDLWMRYSYRFAANIKANSTRNILVANNRLNDAITDTYEQPGYKVRSRDEKSVITYADGKKVPFDYANHYGIIVNRSGKSGDFTLAATPDTEPGLFRPGVTVRDNWIYHTMRVGLSASGGGLVIQDNQIVDQANKQWWTNPTGLQAPKGSVTLENRAIDWSGWQVKITGNQYEVYRHKVADTGYLSVDGEGILIQECCGGTTVDAVEITGNTGNAYIGLYKVRDIQNVAIANNTIAKKISDTASIYVVADTNDRSYSLKNAIVENNAIEGDILVKASAGGSGNKIRNNRGTGKLEYSCHVAISENTGFQEKPCL